MELRLAEQIWLKLEDNEPVKFMPKETAVLYFEPAEAVHLIPSKGNIEVRSSVVFDILVGNPASLLVHVLNQRIVFACSDSTVNTFHVEQVLNKLSHTVAAVRATLKPSF